MTTFKQKLIEKQPRTMLNFHLRTLAAYEREGNKAKAAEVLDLIKSKFQDAVLS